MRVRSRRLVGGVLVALALAPGADGRVRAEEPRATGTRATARIALTAGRSTVLDTDFDVRRIAVTNPAIADAVVVQPREVLVDGKAPGTISLILWGAAERRQYDVVVDPPAPALEHQLRQLFPQEGIQVATSADAVVLSGRVSSAEVVLRAGDVARAASPKAGVVNLLQVPGVAMTRQVRLQVRFAEAGPEAMARLRTAFVSGADARPPGAETFGQFLIETAAGARGLMSTLQAHGDLHTLGEPSLIAHDGQEASLTAGGEFPVPVLSPAGPGPIAIAYKEFGLRFHVRPLIAGDVVRLRIRPEISTLDYSRGVQVQGVRVPAVVTRRAETEVELRDGQSLAIAGLAAAGDARDTAAQPALGALPIVGGLFRARAERKEGTELLVIVTPQLIRPPAPIGRAAD